MTPFTSESEVITKIAARLTLAGASAKVSLHSDTQAGNTIVRRSVFKAAIALEGSEQYVNAMCDIGTDEDRMLVYKGSQVEPTEAGEVRYLFFEAAINPYKG